MLGSGIVLPGREVDKARPAEEQYLYGILDKAHQAMVTGLVLLILAAALAWFATRGRAQH